MAEVRFYHLTRSTTAEALPLLLARTLDVGKRALVLCPDAASVAALDEALWATREPAWLPHGTARDGDADLQPIWLTEADDAAPNAATFLFLVEGAVTAALDRFERAFDLFDGGDEAKVAAARDRWRTAKAAGHAVSYWQQGPRGWEQKA